MQTNSLTQKTKIQKNIYITRFDFSSAKLSSNFVLFLFYSLLETTSSLVVFGRPSTSSIVELLPPSSLSIISVLPCKDRDLHFLRCFFWDNAFLPSVLLNVLSPCSSSVVLFTSLLLVSLSAWSHCNCFLSLVFGSMVYVAHVHGHQLFVSYLN